jgi:hypothetical protein
MRTVGSEYVAGSLASHRAANPSTASVNSAHDAIASRRAPLSSGRWMPLITLGGRGRVADLSEAERELLAERAAIIAEGAA